MLELESTRLARCARRCGLPRAGAAGAGMAPLCRRRPRMPWPTCATPAGQRRDDPLCPGLSPAPLATFVSRSTPLPQATISARRGAWRVGGARKRRRSDVVILHASAFLRTWKIRAERVVYPSQIILFLVRRLGEGAMRDPAVTGGSSTRLRPIGWAYRHLCATVAEVDQTLGRHDRGYSAPEPQALADRERSGAGLPRWTKRSRGVDDARNGWSVCCAGRKHRSASWPSWPKTSPPWVKG